MQSTFVDKKTNTAKYGEGCITLKRRKAEQQKRCGEGKKSDETSRSKEGN